jgi:hypothetical protein
VRLRAVSPVASSSRRARSANASATTTKPHGLPSSSYVPVVDPGGGLSMCGRHVDPGQRSGSPPTTADSAAIWGRGGHHTADRRRRSPRFPAGTAVGVHDSHPLSLPGRRTCAVPGIDLLARKSAPDTVLFQTAPLRGGSRTDDRR